MKSGIILVILGIAIIMGAVAFAFYKTIEVEQGMTACTLEAKVCPDGTVVGREGPQCEFAACPSENATFDWTFRAADKINEDVAVPHTEVILTYNNEDFHMGTYDGTCTKINETRWELLENEQEAAVCWNSRIGTEIGVFLEDGRFLVKRGRLEVAAGETDHRGEFVTIYTLP
jgi:hypothetical protein